MGKARGLVVALVSIACGSCGGARHAPPEPAPVVKTYGPLGIKADAKAPNQAVILGTDDHDGSTILPLPSAPARTLVDAMVVHIGAGATTGSLTPVKLGTAPNADLSVEVGIYEDVAGGAGPQWRAGVWVSAFVAATTLNKDLTDFMFSASSAGYLDGASASGLMAGGFLAMLTGAPIDTQATMTGTINPDGTIGPVGGIPEKFLGSIAKGKRKLGYPIGMRNAKSEATGEDVDLVQLAKDHGAEAIEIADVHEAYALLTGKKLPETVPVAEAEMALDAPTTAALAEHYKAWQQRLAGDWSVIVQLDSAGALPSTLTYVQRLAKENAEAAEKLRAAGKLPAAYARLLAAWAYASSAARTFEVLTRVRAGDLAGARDIIAGLGKIDSDVAFAKIGALHPTTLGGHLVMMASFQAALRGWGYKTFADEAVASAQDLVTSLGSAKPAELGGSKVADAVANAVAPMVLYVDRTTAGLDMAVEELAFEGTAPVNYMCSVPNVLRLASSFQSASVAGINYFDNLLVIPLAQSEKIAEDDARVLVARREPDYLVAVLASKLAGVESGLPADLKAKWGEHSLAWGLFSLAGSELAYYDAAELIAKYYSLGVHTDDTGKVTSLDHEKAFAHMLATAERTARASARAARIATGAIPVQAKLSYQLAASERDAGELPDQLEALANFWLSSAYSQTAVMLARN
jgi:uncharacterized protein